jgi:peptidoglycan/xylan/chitin deacetylase (PgdA/CDA1 family)
MGSPFRVVIFSGGSPEDIRRLIERIHEGVPEARVCGVLTERRPGKSRSARMRSFVRNLRHREFIRYASGRVAEAARAQIEKIGESLLHTVHGRRPPAPREEDFESFCRDAGCAIHVTTDYHGVDSLDFVRALQPDLGLVYGTRILKPSLFTIPKQGSINIHKRKVPDYRGGGPVGLWELLDGAKEIGVTVHEVTAALDAGAVVNEATIPIEPFDTLTSLALKAHVVGNDLLVRSVGDFARGTVSRRRQEGEGRMFKAPSAAQLARYERTLAQRRPPYRPFRSRPVVKLLLKTALAAPGLLVRNRRHSARASYPVTILFHHLVADRPHRMGMSTEHFLKHVRFLQKFYRVVSLQEAIGMLRRNEVTAPTVVLTFDDGYRDNFLNVRAVAEKTRVPITWFVSTDHITREQPFQHDLDAGFPGFLPLTWAHVRQMQAEGFEIGSHTQTHFDCGSTSPTLLHDEIVGSKTELEARLGRAVETFSFPFGLPENISTAAALLAARTYTYVLSAYGGDNPPGGPVKHLKRWAHPNHLWELELLIQGQLEREQGGGLPHAAFEAPAGSATLVEA